MIAMTTSQKKPDDEQFTEAEAKRRFERAVDASLRTPPVHREKPPAKKAKTKKP